MYGYGQRVDLTGCPFGQGAGLTPKRMFGNDVGHQIADHLQAVYCDILLSEAVYSLSCAVIRS